MEIKIREVCGDWALDLPMVDKSVYTLYFNARQNALNVKQNHANISKSRFVELPCNVGDMVYYIEGGYYRSTNLKVRPIKVTEISRKNNRSGKDLGWAIIANGTRYKFSSIGKIVFLTREEAEQALKERSSE